MNNRQLLALAKKAVRLPQAVVTDKNGKKSPSDYFLANPNAYKRVERAQAELARFGFGA